MPNVPINKDLNEPLTREGVRVTRKVNGQIVTEVRGRDSGEIQEDSLLAGITERDLQGPLSGLGERFDEDTVYPTVPVRSNLNETIEKVSEAVQSREIIKKAIKSVVSRPEIKSELVVDWYEDEDYREVIAEEVVASYEELGFTKQEVLNVINQIYN